MTVKPYSVMRTYVRAASGPGAWDKLPFYATHHVDEVVIVDPEKRSVDWLALAGDGYEPVECSGLLELGPNDWPRKSTGPSADERA